MKLVAMRHRAGASPLQRQAELGAVKRLDLVLFVYRQNDGVRRTTSHERPKLRQGVFEMVWQQRHTQQI